MLKSALGVAENAGVIGLVEDEFSINQAVVDIACLDACDVLETRRTFSYVRLRLDVDLF